MPLLCPYLSGRSAFQDELLDRTAKLLRQLANLYVVATHPGEVFNKHGRDIPGLDSGQHFLKSGALHGGAGNAIVYEKQGICIAFFPCYL